MAKSLEEMAAEVTANNIDKGWYETDRTFGDDIALLHSEVSEALEEYRNRGDVGNSYKFEFGPGTSRPVYVPGDIELTDDDAMKEAVARWRAAGIVPKPIGAASEFADVLIRLLDTCARHGVDLEAEYEQKMAYNRTRPNRHGGKVL
jgi:hypothetical protein